MNIKQLCWCSQDQWIGIISTVGVTYKFNPLKNGGFATIFKFGRSGVDIFFNPNSTWEFDYID